MRFYSIVLSDPTGKKQILPAWSSYPGGRYDSGALNVSMDLFVYPQHTPMGASWIKIEGVDPKVLTGAHNYTGMTITMSGGMGSGLPLANPKQQGILVQGQAWQVFGNWVGTEVSLNFFFKASPYTQDNPGNIVHNWRSGTSLIAALTNCLKVAYPNAKVQMHITDQTVPYDEISTHNTISSLARLLYRITANRVHIVMNGNVIRVFDNTYQPPPKQLNFFDFIGQPMWIEPATIQIKTALRGDIQVGDIIEMPTGAGNLSRGFPNAPGFVQTTAEAYPSQLNYQSAMQGKFVVNKGVRHLGNFRQPDGNSWCTIINAAALNVTSNVMSVP